MIVRAALALIASSLLLPAAAPAQDRSERIVQVIHSDLPLYAFDWEEFWPRNFQDGNDFGCLSLVPDGDWQFTPDRGDDHGHEAWYRFKLAGVFHCTESIKQAETRAELDSASHERGFFVRLGKDRIGSVEWELWALQIGTRPGSDYTLLARESATKGRSQYFRVLQQRCPAASIRETKQLDVWSTRYCAINSREELLSLARRMLQLPPVGTVKRRLPPPRS